MDPLQFRVNCILLIGFSPNQKGEMKTSCIDDQEKDMSIVHPPYTSVVKQDHNSAGDVISHLVLL